MDYQKYDDLQLQLTSIGYDFSKRIEELLEKSTADAETKQLVSDVCKEIANTFDTCARRISETAKLLTK